MMEQQYIVSLLFEYPNMIVTEKIEDNKVKSSIFIYSKISKEDIDIILSINPLSTFIIVLEQDIISFDMDEVHYLISGDMLDNNVDITFRIDKLLDFEEYFDIVNKTKDIDEMVDKCILIL